MSQTSLPSMLQPAIAYAILHQPRQGVDREEYEGNLRELHARIADEATAVARLARRVRAELAERESSFLRSALAQFLQTPLRSDELEVRRLLGDTIQRAIGRVLAADDGALLSTAAGEVWVPAERRTPEKRLAAAGRAYIDHLGFTAGRGELPLYESLFVVRGGGGLDALEHIVRDRLGIGGPPHGVHLSMFGRSTYALHNLVLSRADGGSGEEDTEVTFHFEKPRVGYGEFRDGLGRIADGIMESLKPAGIGVWQRKLGLGSGLEFVLRVKCRESQAADVAAHVSALKTDDPAEETLARNSRLLMKTFLP